MSYETKAELKNVNLRNELAGDDKHVSAFDLKFEMPFTPELHKLLCKNINKPIDLHALQDCGLDSVKYSTEVEGVSVDYGDFHIVGAKLNNAVMKMSTTNTGSVRIQAQIGTQHGVVEALNELCGEPLIMTIDEETLAVSIEAAQIDLLDDGEDKSQDLSPKPNAENKSPSDKKPAPAKKSVKKKTVAKKDTGADTTTEKKQEGVALHVVGDAGVEMDDEEKAKAEAEKNALLSRVTKSPKSEENASTEVQQALDMVLDLDQVKMGQGDESDFAKLRERLDAGKPLNMSQVEQLNDLYIRYAA